MKIDKKKVVFISIIVTVLIFIVTYSMLMFNRDEMPEHLEQPTVPELEEEQEIYTSKINALEDLKEERERSIPSLYEERYLDSMDAYAPAIEEERRWVVDSTLRIGIVELTGNENLQVEENTTSGEIGEEKTQAAQSFKDNLDAGHATFFLSAVTAELSPNFSRNSEITIRAEINGTQTVKSGDRLELILDENAQLQEEFFPKNTLLYGFVTLQHNRVQIKITHVKGKIISLKAFDLQDSKEGIYVRNSFRAEAEREVLDDLVQDVNIAGLPQINGIKNIFKKSNRNLKVTILDGYQLILKAEK